MSTENETIDESLYSRQLYAFGHEAMQKMKGCSVLICGLGGLGVEIAKNVILSGVKSVVLYDPKSVTYKDLSSQYYLTSEDLDKNRVDSCIDKLSELNPYVQVSSYKGVLEDTYISNFSVVVVIDYHLVDQIKLNDACRSLNKTAFISCTTKGLFGSIFCDFGESFTIRDPDGEDLLTGIITTITSDDNTTNTNTNKTQALVKCVNPHGLTTDDFVKITIGDKTISKVRVTYNDLTSFKIDFNTENQNKNILVGGDFIQVKDPITTKFSTLANSIKDPQFINTNFTDFERPLKLHACNLAYNDFVTQNNRDPTLTVEDYSTFEKSVRGFSKLEEIDTKVIRQFIHSLKGDLCPMQAVIGGIVSQEVMKACSGKYTPIKQWLYFDSFDCLPDNFEELDTNTNLKSRYVGQTVIFGQKFQEKLANQNWFVVGAGAIGCEHLKNFAMIGLASGEKGKIYITDMDTIEKSNLNRQFLFRSSDIGKLKSKTAARVVQTMNPDIKIEVHENRVGPETEKVYNSGFYKNLDGVANALDNIQARLYMDSQCVFHKKPLLEAGTLSTKGNVQVVVPDVTESYGSSRDPPEQSIPVCTLKNFPYEIAHTIQYARDQFEGLFTQKIQDVLNYIQDPEKLKLMPYSDLLSTVENIKFVLNNKPNNLEDCIQFAVNYWHLNYRDNIKDLLVQFPSDAKTSSDEPFWSGSKKCPKPLEFNLDNELHNTFIINTALLWAQIFNLQVTNLQVTNDENKIQEIFKNIKLPEYTFTKIHISTTEKEEKEHLAKEPEKILSSEEIIVSIPKTENINLSMLTFEKDDDTNHHIDFITAASNLRASNYSISPATKHHTKKIAGKIIPAICTTTAVVSGLVCLELYKIVQGFSKVENFNNGFINLGINFFGFSDPMEVPVTEFKGKKFTMWDSFEVQGDMTLQQFLEYFKEKYDYNLSLISYNQYMIYSDIFDEGILKERMDKTIKDITEELLEEKINKDMMVLTIDVDEDDSEDDSEEVDLPQVKYYL